MLKQLRDMGDSEFWLAARRLLVDSGKKLDLRKPPSREERWWAQSERAEMIRNLEHALYPRLFRDDAKGRRIWATLVKTQSRSELRKACGRWAQLPDVRKAALTPFPQHVVANAAKFLSMKRNKRFPRSAYGDNARLNYLSRGMAGVMMDVSPMTAIERLRNMKHGPDGPLWRTGADGKGYCDCWRCSLTRADERHKAIQFQYENELSQFKEIASKTKIPKEWKKSSNT